MYQTDLNQNESPLNRKQQEVMDKIRGGRELAAVELSKHYHSPEAIERLQSIAGPGQPLS